MLLNKYNHHHFLCLINSFNLKLTLSCNLVKKPFPKIMYLAFGTNLLFHLEWFSNVKGIVKLLWESNIILHPFIHSFIHSSSSPFKQFQGMVPKVMWHANTPGRGGGGRFRNISFKNTSIPIFNKCLWSKLLYQLKMLHCLKRAPSWPALSSSSIVLCSVISPPPS